MGWFADGGASRPDHWRREPNEDVTLTVWSKANGRWVWEVWLDHGDDPTHSGEVDTFEEAKAAAELVASPHVKDELETLAAELFDKLSSFRWPPPQPEQVRGLIYGYLFRATQSKPVAEKP